MRKLLFFLGKGGVGKTTLSSSTAVRLAERGSRVLVVSLDPAHNLGDVFGKKLGDEPKRVADRVDAAEVELEKWVKKYLNQAREEMRSTYSYTASLNLDSYMSILKYSPGTEEYAVLWAIEHVQATGRETYEVIIFDTPPTALSLRFLAMPTISRIWVNELARMRKLVLEKRQTVMRLNPNASVLKGASSTTDDRVYLKLDSIRGRLSALHDLFAKESYLTVVVNPDDLSLAESLRIRDELAALGIFINSIAFNKTFDENWYRQRIEKAFDGFPIFRSNLLNGGVRSTDDLSKIADADFVEHILCCI